MRATAATSSRPKHGSDPVAAAPAAVVAQLNRLVAGFCDELADELVGVYLHGSLALGCFNPARSDLDLLVVTREPLMPPPKRRLAQFVLASSRAPSPIEISFVNLVHLHPWEHPARYDLHYSEHWREALTAELEDPAWPAGEPAEQHDEDLAAHVTMTRARGRALRGPPAAEVLPRVPAAHFRASIVSDFHWGRERAAVFPMYFVLNTCRGLAYLAEGQLLSKAEGGAWALRSLPVDFHPLVASALAEYAAEPGASGLGLAAVSSFATFASTRFTA